MTIRLRRLILSLVLLISSMGIVCAQTLRVSGMVRDSKGMPLPNVSVTVKLDNSKRTTTDSEGKFALETPQQAVLVFTLTGKKTAEVTATDKPLEVILENVDKKNSAVTTMRQTTSINTKYYPLWVIDGVVYKQDKDFNTADLASPDANRIIAAALPGLSERDIEDFTVITDASATALYGNQATGGVISVRTRKAQQGTNFLSYTSQLTYRFRPSYREFNILNSQDHLSMMKELEAGGTLTPENVLYKDTYGIYGWMYDNSIKYENGKFYQDNTRAGQLAYLRQAELRNTDWFKELFQNSIKQQHTITLNSGSQKASYYATLGVTLDPGWAKETHSRDYFFSLNATFKPLKDWTFGMRANASYGQYHGGNDFTALEQAQSLSRTMDPNTYYRYKYTPFNIKNELRQNYRDDDDLNLRLQASLEWNPIRQFRASLVTSLQVNSVAYEFTRTEHSNVAQRFRAMDKRIIRSNNPYLYKPAEDIYALPQTVMPSGGYRTVQDYLSRKVDVMARAIYTDSFDGGKHTLTATVGSDLYDNMQRNGWHNEYGVNFDLGQLQTYDPLIFRWLRDRSENYFKRTTTIDRNVAFVGSASYQYLGRYTLDASFRYEGTNKYGKATIARWMPTWNVALGWDVTSEPFFEHLRPLSSLSTKLSYRMTATLPFVYNSNQRIKPYLPFRPNGISETELYIDQPANHDLTYEKMYELNWDVNVGILEDRISASLSLFSRQGRDLVDVSYNQGTGGFFKLYGNVASMTAKGVELSLTTQNIRTKDFAWTSTFSYSRNTNKVTKLNSRPDVTTLVSSSGAAREGYPLQSIFSIPFYKLSSEGFPQFYNAEGKIERDHINYSATTNLDYLKHSGTRRPIDEGGFNNAFRWKDFSLSVYVLYSFGAVQRLSSQFGTTYGDYYALGHEFNRRWIKAGDEERTNVPSLPTSAQREKNPTLSNAYTSYNNSDVRIARLDFIQLRDITLGYSIPKPVLEKTFLSSVDLKLQASNLFLIYSDKKLNGALPYGYEPHSIIFTCTVGI